MKVIAFDQRYLSDAPALGEPLAPSWPGADDSGFAREVVSAIESAERVLDEHPDRAALLLDGLAVQLARVWYDRQHLLVPCASVLLEDLERRAPPLAWRLRLALRAPHAQARASHLRELAYMVLRSDAHNACVGSMSDAERDEDILEWGDCAE